MLLTFGICFKQHFDTRYLLFYNPSPPRMFLSLDLLSEYRIQHGAIGPLYVTSSYSTWIFCKGVSGFATDCPCDVWCRGLTTCLLHVGPPFGNRFLNTSWAVGLTYWIVYFHFFIPPSSTKLKGGYTGFTLSVCPSVRLSICGQNHVRSVSSTILIKSSSYLHILSSNFRRCVTCNNCWKIKHFKFWRIL